MFPSPPKPLSVKISVLKISAQNVGGRKGSSFLFVSQTLGRVSSYTEGRRRRDWEQRGGEGGVKKTLQDPPFIDKLS